VNPSVGGARRVEQVMGMPVTVEVADPEVAAAALEDAFVDFAMLDRVFSPFREDSAISRLNRGQSVQSDAAALVDQALHLCSLYERATHGYFSARPNGTLDPSGLVKGWAIDRACSILERWGCHNFFVDAGGDVQTRGSAASGEPWRVGIRHPVERDKVVRIVRASGLAVATSGTYEKGRHIVDPHTGRAATDFVSLTVVGPDILEADVYATAGFAMGRDGLGFIDAIAGYEALAIDHEMRGTWTRGFDAFCEAAPGRSSLPA
jgi:FAD:protein FMN transferase